MRIRRFGTIAGAMALLVAGTMQSAHADEVVDYDVGGGVASLQVEVYAQDYTLLPPLLGGHDNLTFGRAVEAVIMGKNGRNTTKAVTNKKVGNLVSIKGGYVSIKGYRNGNPFAEGHTLLTGVTIQGTAIKAIETACLWKNGSDPTGSVLITDANGQTYEPAPNTEVPIPGVGTLYLNEQYIDGTYIYNNAGGSSYQQVIYVYGARLHVESDVTESFINNAETDIILGFTSCDPIKLPNLSGLKLGTSSS